MPYIEFTKDQKRRANEIDLPEFLRDKGEQLVRSGPEYRLVSDHSVTVSGNRWYDHAEEKGGGPVSLLKKLYGLSYLEAVTRLLGGAQGELQGLAQELSPREKKEFVLPPASRDMRRTYAHLLGQRKISREVLNKFVRAGLIYESAEPSAVGARIFHNAVFVGKDEHGAARHAHKHGLYSNSPSFKRNVAGCDPRFSFHHTGLDSQLFVFEAPNQVQDRGRRTAWDGTLGGTERNQADLCPRPVPSCRVEKRQKSACSAGTGARLYGQEE